MKKLLFLFIILIIIVSCRKTHFKCDQEVSYKNDIQPLINDHCIKCHSFNTYPLLQPYASSGSLKTATIDNRRMPPQGEKNLSLKERKKIYCWIESGAPNN